MRYNRLMSLGFWMAVLFTSRPAAAQQSCGPEWLPGQGIPGLDGAITAMTAWENGPGPGLYVGGSFELAFGDIPLRHVARWDGSTFSPLGSGVDRDVLALTVFDGELIVAGHLQSADGTPARSIARWNGSRWASLADGTDGIVYALAVFNGELIVAGEFGAAGGVPAANVARWNGTAWSAMGGGFPHRILALAVHEGALVAAGSLYTDAPEPAGQVARWDGASWSPIGSPGYGTVNSLAVYEGELIAAGSFFVAAEDTYRNVSRWDGMTWFPLGRLDREVSTLAVHKGELFAGGQFRSDAGVPASCIARWDGQQWTGVNGGVGTHGFNDRVSALATYDDALVAGGIFGLMGGLPAGNIARWNDATWTALIDGTDDTAGVNGRVTRTAVYEDDLIVTGDFTAVGGVAARTAAKWDGTSWVGIDSGWIIRPEAMVLYNDELIAGGGALFSPQGGVYELVRWDGTGWEPILASGGQFRAMAVYDGELIEANQRLIGGPRVPTDVIGTLRRWDGTTWSTIVQESQIDFSALSVYQGELIVAGTFAGIDGVPAKNIARWNGTTWFPMGEGLDNTISHLIVHHDQLIALRQYNGRAVMMLWDGAHWSPLGAEIGGSIADLTVFNGELIAGGQFMDVGNYIARWDGSNWTNMASGVNDNVYTLTTYTGQLVAGGDFTVAGGAVSAHLARWGVVDTDQDGVADACEGPDPGPRFCLCGCGTAAIAPLTVLLMHFLKPSRRRGSPCGMGRRLLRK